MLLMSTTHYPNPRRLAQALVTDFCTVVPCRYQTLAFSSMVSTGLAHARHAEQGAGIALTARMPPTSPNSLLDSPLPLALELMRGRALSLVGTIPLKDLELECTSEIDLYVRAAFAVESSQSVPGLSILRRH